MGDTLIFTVNHRLARYLFCNHSEQQIKAGKKAWETPPIHEIKSWFKSINPNNNRFFPYNINPEIGQGAKKARK